MRRSRIRVRSWAPLLVKLEARDLLEVSPVTGNEGEVVLQRRGADEQIGVANDAAALAQLPTDDGEALGDAR